MWRPKASRSIASAAVLLLAVSGGAAVAASSADQARKAKPADLVVKDVTGSITGTTATVSAKVTNKAPKKTGKKSKATAVSFVLSADTTAGAGDPALGQLAVPKLKPKKSATVAGSLAVPATVPAGSYYVVACADPGSLVKEKKEQNNCSASAAKVTVAAAPQPPTGPTITVTYSATSPQVGSVTAVASNGTCVANAATGGGVCTVTQGVGTVELTATTSPVPFGTYVDGASGPCDGNKVGAKVTFTNPTANKSCVAVHGA